MLTAGQSAGHWQLPSGNVKRSQTPSQIALSICKGLLRALPPQGDLYNDGLTRVNASTFICGKGLGQPVLVLVYEVAVDKAAVLPARSALKADDFKWVSAHQYESMSGDTSEVRALPARLPPCD